MTDEEFRRVEAWLYKIPRIEIALENLKLELQRLETKHQSPPTWVSNPNVVPVTGGNLDNWLEKWVEFEDEYDIRRNELLQQIQAREHQLACFNKVLDMLRAENSQLVQLVKAKYIDKIRPDSAIYNGILFVSKNTFYKMRYYVVKAFYDCLPGQFGDFLVTKRGKFGDYSETKNSENVVS